MLSSGEISSVFGPEFRPQDGYFRQVRMPEPPLLLADRVTGIDAVARSMTKGTIWTETDVRADSWYLNYGRMPAGIMIEAGQADLLLISWLGVDLINRSERIYRLLGCELTYHGELPRPGETLVYDIHVDGHAKHGDVRLFFFHYDCHIDGKLRLSVRGGQAGFFTTEELSDSAGILWRAEETPPVENPSLDPPSVTVARSYDADALRAFAAGDASACFGEAFAPTRSHVRTPAIQGEPMLLVESVSDFDPHGGPWKRGYLRAELPIEADRWFFKGHFKNDPCMPGTLMFEGCVQAMSFYLAALGYTIERDGWRFEPVHDHTISMRCRGQVTPTSKLLTYEVFVEEVVAGPIPTLWADLLCTVDGLKAFHAKRVGLRLVPAWPLDAWSLAKVAPALAHHGTALAPLGGLADHVEAETVAEVDGFKYGLRSLLACAWGRPSEAFGPMYERFDSARKVPRLPGPPYHFMSRITRIDAPQAVMQRGGSIEVEYDIPSDAWYFAMNGAPVMPFAVLMEAALQPCGWLASYIGSTLGGDVDLMFRNLDGTGTLTRAVTPEDGVLTTYAKVTNVSKAGPMIIESFEVTCRVGDETVYAMKTVFGFFPKEAFENQAGLPVEDIERAKLEAPSDHRHVFARGDEFLSREPRIAAPRLLMLDAITGWEPAGGRAGLGWIRGVKKVDPGEWFFKAHFFQDPVQPGSLGVEAMVQIVEVAMRLLGLDRGVANPAFEPVVSGAPVTWKYRGQVVPSNREIASMAEIVEIVRDERGVLAWADTTLWVDGKKIYACRLGVRVVPGAAPCDEVLDASVDRWLGDHRPTWTLPALPMMSMVDRMIAAAERRHGRRAAAIENVQLHRWVTFEGAPVKLRVEVGDGDGRCDVELQVWREARTHALSRYERAATAVVVFDDVVAPPPELEVHAAHTEVMPDPYAAGWLFHGPAFQWMTAWRLGDGGALAEVALGDTIPHGAWNQGLLDVMTHAVPHDMLHRWAREVPRDVAAYPHRVAWLVRTGEIPREGFSLVRARFAGFDGDERHPAFDIEVWHQGTRRLACRLVDVLVPKGRIGAADPIARKRFLEGNFVEGLRLSTERDGVTTLPGAALAEVAWMPGNVEAIYGLSRGARMLPEVAMREHAAARLEVHPREIVLDGDVARVPSRPLRRVAMTVSEAAGSVEVYGESPGLDVDLVNAFWREQFNVGAWPAEDIFYALIQRFVADVVVTAPGTLEAIESRGAVFLANHQVACESLLFSVLIGGLTRRVVTTIAKAEHRDTWVGTLIKLLWRYPGVKPAPIIEFIERGSPESLQAALDAHVTAKTSLLVHIDGTRALAARTPAVKLSSVLLEVAMAQGLPIVPTRFTGALPVEPLEKRLEFPVGQGKQTIWLGAPIEPETLAALPLKERKQLVTRAINALGPAEEVPSAPSPDFEATVGPWRARGVHRDEHAVIAAAIAGASLDRSGWRDAMLSEGATAWDDGDSVRAWVGDFARWLRQPRAPD